MLFGSRVSSRLILEEWARNLGSWSNVIPDSEGCYLKSPETGWHEKQINCSLKILEFRSPKIKECLAVLVLFERESIPCLSLMFGLSWQPLVLIGLQIYCSNLCFCLHIVFPFVSMSFLLTETFVFRFTAHLDNPRWSYLEILSLIISAKIHFLNT